jgi:ribulose-5-phosphate 4-epimerase/fuculose-1-phosphate aldolase
MIGTLMETVISSPRTTARVGTVIVALVVGTQLAGAQGMTTDPDAERKQDLVTAYKILINEGILDSFGHVSVRSAKDPNIFLMPRAMPPSLVSQEDILELRVSDSQPIEPKGRRVNGERYIHGEIYKARPDVMSVIHSHSQAVIPLSLTPIKLKPVVVQAGFLPPETPTFEIRDAINERDRGMQVTDSTRGAALARTLAAYPAALMRGHGNVVVGTSIKQAVVYAAYVDINARMQTQALLLSRDVVVMNDRELFTPQEFDINRPWEHFKQKLLDEAARAKIDRSQFGLEQTQTQK